MSSRLIDGVFNLSRWAAEQNLNQGEIEITFKSYRAAQAFRDVIKEEVPHFACGYEKVPQMSSLFGVIIDDSKADVCPTCGSKK